VASLWYKGILWFTTLVPLTDRISVSTSYEQYNSLAMLHSVAIESMRVWDHLRQVITEQEVRLPIMHCRVEI